MTRENATTTAQDQFIVARSDSHLVPARLRCQFARDQEQEGLAVYRRQTQARGLSECLYVKALKPNRRFDFVHRGLVSGNRTLSRYTTMQNVSRLALTRLTTPLAGQAANPSKHQASDGARELK